MKKIVPVVLCGGSGTRLWPLSRTIHPKQLLSLVNEKTMLQNTLLRVKSILNDTNPIVVCNQDYRFIVAEQLRDIGFQKVDIFLEPEGRNTAPAVTVATLHLHQDGQDPLIMVMPADHVIEDREALQAAIQPASDLAEKGFIVTFGIVPKKPEIGYGYLLRGKKLDNAAAFKVEKFIEKPTLEKAQEFFKAGDYFWNSGIFLFRASTFLEAMHEHAPDILAACEGATKGINADLDFYRLNHDFLTARSESIDYAVMEKSKNLAVIPLETEWSDVGSWEELWQISKKDEAGNFFQGEIFAHQVKNSYLRAEKRLLAVIGLSNIVVIETPDAILVSNKDSSQDIKVLVAALKESQRNEAHTHNCVYRPWGYYDCLNKNENYQVKLIVVKAGAKLSLQSHQHRSEHWIIIKGTATVTRGEEEFELQINQSTYIPTGIKHRIANNTPEELHLIEVQTGDYFGEDDIVRFEDMYGR